MTKRKKRSELDPPGSIRPRTVKLSDRHADYARAHGRDGKGQPDMTKGIRAILDEAMLYDERIETLRIGIADAKAQMAAMEAELARLEAEKRRALANVGAEPPAPAPPPPAPVPSLEPFLDVEQ